MALSLTVDTEQVLTLDEYVETVERNVDFTDLESIWASAPALRALLNDRTLVSSYINRELSSWRVAQVRPTYTAQVFVLATRPDFFVRANIWIPQGAQESNDKLDKSLYFYEVPHDHNFTFVTGGYAGSGYETLIYEYDHDSVKGEVGEHVELRLLEETSLPQNKIMMYRASKDVHSQAHPRELSVSLNLMVKRFANEVPNQYLFDLEHSTISGVITSTVSASTLLCDLAAELGDERTASLLESIADSHFSPVVRAQAYRALARLEPAHRDEIIARACRDRRPYVRKTVQESLLGGALA